MLSISWEEKKKKYFESDVIEEHEYLTECFQSSDHHGNLFRIQEEKVFLSLLRFIRLAIGAETQID